MVTTVEAALNENRLDRPGDTRACLPVTADGHRREPTLLVPERGDDYASLAWLLDEGANALGEAEDAQLVARESLAD